MKTQALLIDVLRASHLLVQKYPLWFANVEDTNIQLKLSRYMIDALIVDTINDLTSHPLKIRSESTIVLSDDQVYDIDVDAITEDSNVSDIFPGIIELHEFIYDDPYFVYKISKAGNSRIITPLYDWRVKEYYRLTNKVNYETICMDEWSDDPSIVNDFINGRRR